MLLYITLALRYIVSMTTVCERQPSFKRGGSLLFTRSRRCCTDRSELVCSAPWWGPSTYKDITLSVRYNSLRCVLDPLNAELFLGGNMSLNLVRIFKAFSKLRHSPNGVPAMRVEVHRFLRGPEGYTFLAQRRRFYQPL